MSNENESVNPRFLIETYTAPSSWASYLINGDASGIEDSDMAAADMFVDWVGFGAPVSCVDAGFCHYHNAFQFQPLAGDCQEYTFIRDTAADRAAAVDPHNVAAAVLAAQGKLG